MATQVGELNYNENEDRPNILGHGSFGTLVYRKMFGPDRRLVAVKRIQHVQVNNKQEVEHMKKARHHRNILCLIHTEIDTNFLFIVTELCSGTLKDYFITNYKGSKFVSEWEMLRQITAGLEHLHRLGIVHRDIKPTNILIFEPESDRSKLLLKLADFGISKALKTDKEDFTYTSVNGTRGWRAPEVYKEERFGFEVDIFALGLIFGYILTGGNHPFGENSERRIRRKETMLIVRKDLKKPYSIQDETIKLIKSMLKMEPLKRPTITGVKECLWDIALSINLFDRKKTSELLTFCCSSEITEDELIRFQQLVNDPTVDIHEVTLSNGSTCLHWLCQHYKNENLKDLVQLLIQKGAGVNAKDESGSTLLHQLCSNYEKDNLIGIVQFLLQKGADVNAKDESGSTPLHQLCFNYEKDNLIGIVQFLIKNGAEVNAKDENGCTSLHQLCFNYEKDNLIGIVEFLVENGADVKTENRNRWTALHSLCHNYQNHNMMDIVQLLIRKGADVNAIDKEGVTPFHELCRHYNNDNLIDIIQLLIESGAKVNTRNSNGLTPLHSLCHNYQNSNMMQIVQLLIENGAEVNAKEIDGWTPLHFLCRYYQNDNLIGIVQLLIKNGAEVNTQNSNGWTSLHFLCQEVAQARLQVKKFQVKKFA